MIQLNELPDVCLLSVLDQLSTKQLFKTLGINRRFNELAAEKIRTKIKAIKLKWPKDNFFICKHPGSINANQTLVLKSVFKDKTRDESSKQTVLLNMLAKCSGVKSIDISTITLQSDVLLEVVRCCPQLDCLKVGQSVVKEDEWISVLDQIGPQLIHFVKISPLIVTVSLPSESWLLETVVEKCANIRRLDWDVNHEHIGDLLAEINNLPENCWLKRNMLNYVLPFNAGDDFYAYFRVGLAFNPPSKQPTCELCEDVIIG